MKFRNYISKLLALGILTNTIYFSSSADTAILNRYETLEGEHITIDDSTEGELVEIEVFGNTVQDENNLEDIQSVGDLYIDENGNPILDKQGREQYKIDIVSKNKNLLEIEDRYAPNINGINITSNSENSSYLLEGSAAGYTSFDATTLEYIGGFYLDFESYYKDKRMVVGQGEYTISYDFTMPIEIYTQNGHYFSVEVVYDDTKCKMYGNTVYDYQSSEDIVQRAIFNVSVDKHINGIYLRRWYGGSCEGIVVENLQVEKGGVVETSFTEPQSNTETILLPAKLQKVGDVADRLYWDNEKGRYVIEKNIIDFQLNKSNVSSVILGYYTYEENQLSGEILLNIDKSLGIGKAWNSKLGILTNKYKGIPKITKDTFSDREYIFLNDGPSTFGFMLNKSKLGENPTSQDVINYIFENGEMGVLTLKNESEIIETNITSKLKIPTYDGKTHIFAEAENGINPTLKVTVDRLPQVAKNAVLEAETTSSLTNISLARMYINMLPESTYKDQLQEQLSQVFSSDIILERKDATANLDVYIKSENMLSMSLDTNSVSFDNYSGVSSMEMKDAVGITISSSLPYSLNAYMASEITSSDGLKTMPIDILNIKEGSKDDYQTFTDTTNKVILKEDCEKGNGMNHAIDLKLDGNNAHVADIYKTVIKFEAEQK